MINNIISMLKPKPKTNGHTMPAPENIIPYDSLEIDYDTYDDKYKITIGVHIFEDREKMLDGIKYLVWSYDGKSTPPPEDAKAAFVFSGKDYGEDDVEYHYLGDIVMMLPELDLNCLAHEIYHLVQKFTIITNTDDEEGEATLQGNLTSIFFNWLLVEHSEHLKPGLQLGE